MRVSVLDYGARQNSGLLQTAAFQRAVDAVFLQGGGCVEVPEGEYLIAGLRLRSHITLHLLEGAVLKGSPDPLDYFEYLADPLEPISQEERQAPSPNALRVGNSVLPCSRWNNAILRIYKAEDVCVLGEKDSCIDGGNCYDPQGEEGYRGPHGISAWYSKGLTFRGYTLQHAGNWAHAFQNSQNILAEEVTVQGGHDGFDFRSCDGVVLRRCTLHTGDDCVAGFDNVGVTVEDCLLSCACSLFRMGGHDLVIQRCQSIPGGLWGHRYTLTEEQKRNGVPATAQNSRTNTLCVFLYYCDFRAAIRKPPKAVVRDCSFVGADCLFSHPFGNLWCCNVPMEEMVFENCHAEGLENPMDISGDFSPTVILRGCTVLPRSADTAARDGRVYVQQTKEKKEAP